MKIKFVFKISYISSHVEFKIILPPKFDTQIQRRTQNLILEHTQKHKYKAKIYFFNFPRYFSPIEPHQTYPLHTTNANRQLYSIRSADKQLAAIIRAFKCAIFVSRNCGTFGARWSLPPFLTGRVLIFPKRPQ